MSREVTLTQDCFVETRQNGQSLTNGVAAKGETVTLLTGNGYRTVVKPLLQWQDEHAEFNSDNTISEIDAADERLKRAAKKGRISVYGACYEGEVVLA